MGRDPNTITHVSTLHKTWVNYALRVPQKRAQFAANYRKSGGHVAPQSALDVAGNIGGVAGAPTRRTGGRRSILALENRRSSFDHY